MAHCCFYSSLILKVKCLIFNFFYAVFSAMVTFPKMIGFWSLPSIHSYYRELCIQVKKNRWPLNCHTCFSFRNSMLYILKYISKWENNFDTSTSVVFMTLYCGKKYQNFTYFYIIARKSLKISMKNDINQWIMIQLTCAEKFKIKS